MADNFTAAQTHSYDQNIAWANEQADHLISVWAELASTWCCTEHAALVFVDAALAEVQRLGPEAAAVVLLACTQRLASREGKDQ